jgi:hypothetical protein
MRAVNVTTTSAMIVKGHSSRKFVHIRNVSDTDIYLAYDGEAAATVAEGMLLKPDETLLLSNDNQGGPYLYDVHAIHGDTGNKEVRIQGVSSTGT